MKQLVAVFGFLIPPLGPLVVLTILGLSALFTFGIDFPKYYMFQKFGL